YDQWEVEQSANGAAADVYGVELTWQQQLTFLPGALNGLGIYANYTYIQSEFTVPGLESTRTVRLPGMRPRVGNVSLSYEKFGFSGRLSLNFYDTFIDELAERPEDDVMEIGRKQLDFSASQKINNRIKLFAGISNINNAQMKLRFRDGRPTDHKFYSAWGNIGIKYSPF
ncbi:MAG TPA: TonB-dependent receptor, partial [Anseongella sp.]|nr:TonB-dependent receptor [Anseongella sp.]